MASDRWQRLQEVFEQAERLAPSERDAFLDETCQGDDALRREVKAMLEVSAGSEEAVLRPLEAAARVAFPAAAEGERIGAWRLVRLLGQGGMGTVYVAERDDQAFQKQAALKLLRSGLATEELRTRFRSERQILAHLEHPNIARLLDGGETADGRPWVALELVDGEPLTDHCERRGLSVEERVRLMLPVCDAVQYAHTNLVVHRDLKPANILVTKDGVPKLLDFGIAKLLEPGQFAGPVAETQFAERLLTPEYAAPEQITTNAVSTATDVYQLGMLLYVLVAGRGPWNAEGMAPHELSAAICTQEPPAPGRWGRVPADLETVILAALRKEPARRYASPALLAEDLRRWLGGYPVSARRDTWSYRASKFVRRNRLGVAAAALFVLSLAGLSAGLYVEARRAERERDKAQRVASFLVDIFRDPDPQEGRGNDVTAREILDQGTRRAENELAGLAEAQGLLLDNLSRTWRNLGDHDRARPLAEKSLAVRRSALGEDHPDTAASMQTLGHLLTVAGKYQEAEPNLRKALEIQLRHLGPGSMDTATTQNILGMLLFYMGRYEEAAPMLEASIATAQRREGPASRLAALSLNNLALVRRAQGRYADAEKSFRTLLETQRPVLGETHPSVALYTANLGLVLYDRSRYYEAEPLLRTALETWRQVHKGDDHLDVALGQQYLASCLMAQGRLAEAEPIWRRLIEYRGQRLGPENVFVAGDIAALGNLLRMKGDYAGAARESGKALEIRKKILPADDPGMAASHMSLALLERDQGHLPEAEVQIRQALAIREKRLGAVNPYVIAGTRLELAWNLRAQGREAEAAALMREVLELRRARLPNDEWALSDALLARGFTERDEGMLRQALGIRRALRPAGHWEIAEVEWALSRDAGARAAVLAGPEQARARLYLFSK
jgi:eukaryotic-like serine/threonine-protein kinase